LSPLSDPTIRAALSAAWADSQPGSPSSRHEEGGYILSRADGSFEVVRWFHGDKSRLVPPSLDANRCYNGLIAVAAFHTHPNPPLDESNAEWEQAPSTTDRRWHQRQALPGFVISRDLVYEIDAAGKVSVLGAREEVLAT
jgi:hypothetical protein